MAAGAVISNVDALFEETAQGAGGSKPKVEAQVEVRGGMVHIAFPASVDVTMLRESAPNAKTGKASTYFTVTIPPYEVTVTHGERTRKFTVRNGCINPNLQR